MRKFLPLLLALLLLLGCEPAGEKIQPTLDRTEYPITVTVYFYNSQADLMGRYRELHNLGPRDEVPKLWGFARWPQWQDQSGTAVEQPELFSCDIHSMKPKIVDDTATLTLGHELLHCIWGSYHQ